MSKPQEVKPDPYTSKNYEEGMAALKKIKERAIDFTPKKCPTCGYIQELKHQIYCADCLEGTQQKIELVSQ